MATTSADVLVLGLGPSGRALAARLAAHGVDVIAVDLDPARCWTPTYAVWGHELPDWVAPTVVATTRQVRAFARTEHEVADPYLVLDTAALQRSLELGEDRQIAGRVGTIPDRHTVTLTDGRTLSAAVIVDARGSRPTTDKAQQTAVGVVLPADRTGDIEGCWFMDWRADNDTAPGDPPSFLYVVALDADRVLVEETCLVGRPALGLRELRRRFEARLTARGVRLRGDEPTEHVRFAVEPEPPSPGLLQIGAAGGVMHAATGYSVGPSLRLADRLATALATGHPRPSEVIADRRARRVRWLRQAGLATLLDLPARDVPTFFEAFFRLPPDLQRAYLTSRDQPAAVSAAMARMALSLSPRMITRAVSPTLRTAVGTLVGRPGR